MIVLPRGFVSIKYPGYFWDTVSNQLFTLKGGILKPMVMKKSYLGRPPRYVISHESIRRNIWPEDLKKLEYSDTVELFPTKYRV